MPGGYQMRLRAPQMLRKSAWSLRKQDCWLLCGKMGKWACLSSLLELIELPSDSDWLLNLPDPKSKKRLEEMRVFLGVSVFPSFCDGFYCCSARSYLLWAHVQGFHGSIIDESFIDSSRYPHVRFGIRFDERTCWAQSFRAADAAKVRAGQSGWWRWCVKMRQMCSSMSVSVWTPCTSRTSRTICVPQDALHNGSTCCHHGSHHGEVILSTRRLQIWNIHFSVTKFLFTVGKSKVCVSNFHTFTTGPSKASNLSPGDERYWCWLWDASDTCLSQSTLFLQMCGKCKLIVVYVRSTIEGGWDSGLIGAWCLPPRAIWLRSNWLKSNTTWVGVLDKKLRRMWR